MTTPVAPTVTVDETHRMPPFRLWHAIAAICWGCALSFVVIGYHFGQGNHLVYLLPGIRELHPELLSRDWFTVRTLQYHFAFSWFTAFLMRLEQLELGFLIGHVLTVIGLHAAWFGIVRRLGGCITTYLLSVALYHLSAGGLGLGVYSFLQDGEFLPSNVAAVLALLAVWAWLANRIVLAGVCVGLSGIAHLNYAIVGVGTWFVLGAYHVLREHGRSLSSVPARRWARWGVATFVMLVPCLLNVGLSMAAKLEQKDAMSMQQFVDVYVYLRHPHHHAPLTWPIALWLSFLWAIPLAWFALRRAEPTPEVRRVGRLFYFTLGMLAFAFFFAGVTYVSETLVHFSLWRFSIFPKLISCVMVSWLVIEHARVRLDRVQWCFAAFGILSLTAFVLSRLPIDLGITPFLRQQTGLLIGTAALMALAAFLSRRRLATWACALIACAFPASIVLAEREMVGVQFLLQDDASFAEVATWCRDPKNTPIDALFVVPPDDASFQLRSLRSSVGSFKHVPQLPVDLLEWKRRMDRILDMDTLTLPRPMNRTFDTIADRYRSLSAEHLFTVARELGADHVIAGRDFGATYADRKLYASRDGRFVVYRVGPAADSR
jgi:hypothetical protein